MSVPNYQHLVPSYAKKPVILKRASARRRDVQLCMTIKLGRIISSKLRINQSQVQDHHLPQRRLVKVRAPNRVGAHQAAREKAKAKIETDLNPAGGLTPRDLEREMAEIRAKIIAQSALHSAEINVHIVRKIVPFATHHWMKMINASEMHGKQNVIAKADYHMHCHQRESKDQS